MKAVPEPDDDPIHRITDIPRIMEALRLGVQDALRRHKQAGNPIAVWRDGQVVWIAPEDIPVDISPQSDRTHSAEQESQREVRQAADHARPRRLRSPLPVVEKAATGTPITAAGRDELARIKPDEDLAKHDRATVR
jgi:hypothetical protein